MEMRQRWGPIVRQWIGLLGLMLLLHVGLFLGWMALSPEAGESIAPVIGLMVAYGVLLGALLAGFYRRVGVAAFPAAYREATERGLPTTAKVLDIQRTRWRIDRTRNLRFQARPTRFEYRMRVRVTGLDGGAYEAVVADFLSGAQVPVKGAVIPVKVHPHQPEVIVLDRDRL